MKAMAAGTMLILVLALVVGGAFLAVLSIAALVKIIQIAEDLRYIRSKSDISVNRPKSWKNTLIVCLVISLIVIVLVVPLAFSPLSALLAR